MPRNFLALVPIKRAMADQIKLLTCVRETKAALERSNQRQYQMAIHADN